METITPAQLRALAAKKSGRRWSSAKKKACAQGHAHPSKTEAAVCDRLHLEARVTEARVYTQVRLPLLALAPDANGRPLYLTIDFLVVRGFSKRYIDAKAGRVSRDWRRGKAAFEVTYGPIEEVDH